MNFRRFRAVARKEFLHVTRDGRSLGLALAIPVLMLVLFGYALRLDIDHVPLAVWDRSGTPESREFLARFSLSRYFSVRRVASSYREIERAIDEREALVAIVVPHDFTDGLARGRTVNVQAIIDGSDPNTATIALGYARVIALTYSQDVTVSRIERSGGTFPRAAVDVRPRVWFNTDLESKNFIIPGLISVIMMVIAGLLTSLSVSREWEGGTMEQVISTPLKGSELILGKLVPYFVVGMLDVLIAVLMAKFLFDVPLRGNPALVFLISAVFLIGALAMGMTISILTKSQLLSTQLAMIVTYLPALLLSGFMFPISNMPRVIQAVTRIVPARYFVGILRAIYLKGLGLEVLLVETVFLALFGLGVLSLAVARFRKRLD